MNPRNAILYMKLGVQLLQSKLAGWLVGSRVQAMLVRTDQGVFAVDPKDRGVGRRLLLDGAYNEEELARLAGHVSSDADVLVVGTHIGTIAIPLARLCRALVAVEPNPASHALLKTNLLLNDIRNVELLDIAASDEQGSIEMLMSTANYGGSKRVPLRARGIYHYDAPVRIKVRAERLDDVLAGRAFQLVLMDIEGSEYFALRGMQNLLTNCRVLAVEFLPHHLRDVAGVSVQKFLEQIAPHFDTLTVPSKNLTVGAKDFLSVLQGMYEREEGDDSILFSRASNG
jgi:FkbM family methyltransferase